MTVEACVAFASAALVVADVTERCSHEEIGPQSLELLAELRAAHSRLRALFASEADDEVCGLALSILVLADRVVSSLE